MASLFLARSIIRAEGSKIIGKLWKLWKLSNCSNRPWMHGRCIDNIFFRFSLNLQRDYRFIRNDTLIITVSLWRPAEFNGKAPIRIIYFRRSYVGDIYKDVLLIVYVVIQSFFVLVLVEPGDRINTVNYNAVSLTLLFEPIIDPSVSKQLLKSSKKR